MIVLSLFNGIGCAMEAFNRSGIQVEKVYVCEIDKFANAINDYNFPESIHLGDVSLFRKSLCWSDMVFSLMLESKWINQGMKDRMGKLREMRGVKVDYVVGGSPCQSFSFAGKMLGFSDKRGQLLLDFVKIVNFYKNANPSMLFLLENVNMKSSHKNAVTNLMGVKPLRINSNLVSAQNRDRLYWTNIKAVRYGLFDDSSMVSLVPQPEDKGILLKDVLLEEVDEKYLLSEAALKRIFKKQYSKPRIEPDKTGTLNTNNNSGKLASDSGTTLIEVLNKDGYAKRNQLKASCFTAGGNSGGNHSDMDVIKQIKRIDKDGNNRPQSDRIYDENGISPALTAGLGGRLNVKVGVLKFGRTDEAKDLRRQNMKNGKDYTPFHGKEITGIDYEKMNTITTATTKDNILFIEQRGRGFNNGGKYFEKSPTLSSNSWQNNHTVCQYRRLTPLECERLQTMPDGFTEFGSMNGKVVKMSDSARYKCIGNAWTIDVIAHILSFSKK